MLPYFYLPAFDSAQQDILLDEDNSRHIVQVLRMKAGEELLLTDGKGNLLSAEIRTADKMKCRVAIRSAATQPPPERKVAIAISPLKNVARFEWFLEKATEIGVGEIIPLLCERTERQQVRPDRLGNLLVSALLQSRQTWLPVLHPATPFSGFVAARRDRRKLIAWLGGDAPAAIPRPDPDPTVILIGPEGDFSPAEATHAMNNGFHPVSLGKNRLRTESAGVVAAALLCISD